LEWHFQAFGEDWIPKFGVLVGVSLVYDPDAFYFGGRIDFDERQPSF
jgi:hypothetical protein